MVKVRVKVGFRVQKDLSFIRDVTQGRLYMGYIPKFVIKTMMDFARLYTTSLFILTMRGTSSLNA